jgi:L-ascorbate 6-phosphate lactonase
MSANGCLQFLGQVGCLLEAGNQRIIIDPYLSDSVAEQFGTDLKRQVRPPFTSATCPHIDCLLLTHAHLDHTDPATLAPLLKAQPHLRIFAPYESRKILQDLGCDSAEAPPVAWTQMAPGLCFRAVPAAHTEIHRNSEGELRDVGYLLRLGHTTIYHAGDTIPHHEIFSALKGESIDIALLPLNERNHYRDAQGIIGNMTLREAFQMATDLGVKTLIPTHWDMFAPNSVFPEEIELLHTLLKPPFQLAILRSGESIEIPEGRP